MNRSMTNQPDAHNVRVDVFSAQMRALSSHERAAVSHAIDRQNVAELERASIARRIKQARQETGMSQPEMAEALGVIPRTYQNYESVKEPRTPWGSMNDIAKITGKSTEWLIHGDGAQTTPDLFAGQDGLAEIRRVVEQNRRALELIMLKLGINLSDAPAEAPEIPRYPRRPDEDQKQAPGA